MAEPSRCIITGCERWADNICPDHWYALPLKLRQRWWRETYYNNSPPSLKLVAAVNRAIRAGPSEPPPSLREAAAAWLKRTGRHKSDATKTVSRGHTVSAVVVRRMARALDKVGR